MLDATSKALFHGLAQIPTLQRLASKYGMAPGSGFARRFIAGESIEEAVECVKDLPGKGLLLTLDYLGESVSSSAAASAAAADYAQIIDAIVKSGVERNISLKLTQLGLDVDRATAVDNMRRILEPADANGFFVRIDMENSPYTDATLDILDTLRSVNANLSVKTADDVLELATEPLATRNIIVLEQGRYRVRERNVLRYYARSLAHLLAPPSSTH